MSQHRTQPGQETQSLRRPPVVPGGRQVPPLSAITSIEPVLSVDRDPIMIVRNVIAIVRDVLLIALLVLIMIVGHRIIAAANDVKQQIGTFDTPAVAPLPADPCGGGVCPDGG